MNERPASVWLGRSVDAVGAEIPKSFGLLMDLLIQALEFRTKFSQFVQNGPSHGLIKKVVNLDAQDTCGLNHRRVVRRLARSLHLCREHRDELALLNLVFGRLLSIVVKRRNHAGEANAGEQRSHLLRVENEPKPPRAECDERSTNKRCANEEEGEWGNASFHCPTTMAELTRFVERDVLPQSGALT